MANTKCWNPIGCSGGESGSVKAHYQHIAPGINHQWDVQPSQSSPFEKSAPANQACPLDGGQGTLGVATCSAVYTKCMVCGYVKPW